MFDRLSVRLRKSFQPDRVDDFEKDEAQLNALVKKKKWIFATRVSLTAPQIQAFDCEGRAVHAERVCQHSWCASCRWGAPHALRKRTAEGETYAA